MSDSDFSTPPWRWELPPWAMAAHFLRKKEAPHPEVELDYSTLYQIAACALCDLNTVDYFALFWQMAATFNCVFSRALDVSRQVNTNGGNCVKCVRSKLAATVFGIKISLGQSLKALKQEGEWKGVAGPSWTWAQMLEKSVTWDLYNCRIYMLDVLTVVHALRENWNCNITCGELLLTIVWNI